MERQRTFNKVLALFLFRTVLFSCVHVVFYFIKYPQKQQQQQQQLKQSISNSSYDVTDSWQSMSDIIALSSCCWLILTLNLGIVEIIRYLWKMRRARVVGRDNDEQSLPKNKKRKQKLCSILLIPQTDWYTLKSSAFIEENVEVKIRDNNKSNQNNKNHRNEIIQKNTGELVVTPWTLWYYVYAAGIGLFVLGFSINGLSVISETSVILSSIVAISYIFHDDTEASFPLQYLASWGMGIGVYLVLMSNIAKDPYVWGWRLLENMWMAVVLPMMSSVFLCKCSKHARDMNLTPEKILKFAMPSLAVMSAAFLSLYFPVNQQRSFYIQLQTFFENGNVSGGNKNGSIMLQLSESLGYNTQQIDFNKGNETAGYQQQSPIYFSLASFANFTQMDSVKNLVDSGKGLDILMERGNALSVVSILLAPFMLWLVMVTVIGSVIRGLFNAQSALCSYILVMTVKHYLLNGGGPWNIAALVVVIPSCIMTMAAEMWVNSSFYTHYHFDASGHTNNNSNSNCGLGHNHNNEDDEEDEEEEETEDVNTASV